MHQSIKVKTQRTDHSQLLGRQLFKQVLVLGWLDVADQSGTLLEKARLLLNTRRTHFENDILAKSILGGADCGTSLDILLVLRLQTDKGF